MNKLIATLIAGAFAASSTIAVAQTPATPAPAAAPAAPATKAEKATKFQEQQKALQRESTEMPAGSPKVDKAAKPTDPLPPKATTTQGKKEQFSKTEKALEKASDANPAGSPKVDKAAPAADPKGKPVSKMTRAEQDKALQDAQKKSTP
jgi:hypothetical protein